MNKNLIYLLLLLTIVSSLHCKTKDDPCIVLTTVDRPIPESMSQWKFMPGTYWVFQDSASGDLDSIYVTNTEERTQTETCSGGPGSCDNTTYIFVSHAIHLKRSATGEEDIMTLDALGAAIGGSLRSGDEIVRGNLIWFEGEPEAERYPFQCNFNGTGPTIQLGDSTILNLGPVGFSGVKQFEVENSARYFWNEYGWVRWDERDDSSLVTEAWNLIRWNIEL